MIEAYSIGVTLSLRGTIGTQIGAVAAQFEALNRLIGTTQATLDGVAAKMRDMAVSSRSIAEGWRAAATAMERAARASAAGGGGPSGGAPSGPGASAAMPYAPNFIIPGGSLPTGGGSRPNWGAVPLPPPTPANLALYGVAGGTFAGGPGTGSASTALAMAGLGRSPMPPVNLPGGPGARPGGMPGGDMAQAALGFGALGYAANSFVESAFKARLSIEGQQAVLGGMGMSADETRAALARATELQRSVPGITVHGGLEIVKDLMTVTQNAHESLDPALLRSFAQTAVVLSAVGKRDAITELFKAMQSAELKGAFSGADGNPDPAKAGAFLQNVIATTMQTGGRVGPAEILQFIRSGGMGTAMMGNRDLFVDAITPILSMGAARAGTGIQAFAQQFAAGKMSDAGANMLREMGLLDLSQAPPSFDRKGRPQDPLKQYKVGIGQYRIPPNMMIGMEDAATNPREHPIEYMNKVLLPKIDAYNMAHFGAPRDDADRDAQRMSTGAAVASRIPGGNVLGDVIRNWPMIMRDREALAQALKRGENDGAFNHFMQADPRIRMQAFTAAIDGLMVALGGPIMATAIGMINHLTAGLNAIAAWATAHPETAGRLVSVAAGLGALATAIAGLAAVLFVAGPMIRVASWMAGVGAGGVAAAGAAAGTAASTAAPGAAAAATGFAGRLFSLLRGGAGSGAFFDFDEMKRVGSEFNERRRARRSDATDGSGQPVTLTGTVNLDGKKVGDIVGSNIARGASGPSGGTTGFDIRTGIIGSMSATP